MAAIAVQRLGYLDSIHPGLTGNRERCEGDCTQGLGLLTSLRSSELVRYALGFRLDSRRYQIGKATQRTKQDKTAEASALPQRCHDEGTTSPVTR
jgi:hypothetical protein